MAPASGRADESSDSPTKNALRPPRAAAPTAMRYRLLRFLIALLALGLVPFRPESSASPFVLTAVAAAYALFAVARLLAPRARTSRFEVGIDVATQGALVWMSGGVLSVYTPILFVTLVAATEFVSARESFALSTITAVAFCAPILVELSLAAYAESDARPESPEADGQFVSSYLLASTLGLYVCASLGSRLSQGRRRDTELHREILEAMGQGVIAVDSRGAILQINREARRICGVGESATESVGRSLDSVLTGESGRAVASVIDRDDATDHRLLLAAPGETPVPTRVSISRIASPRAKAATRIAVLSNLSLEHHMADAEARIEELERLHVMALGIAHEIRNPLASVRGCVQELERRQLTEEHASRLRSIISRESDRLNETLESFLQYARPGEITQTDVDLGEIVEEASVLIRNRDEFGARSLDVRVAEEPSRAAMQVPGSRDQLIQLLLNLGINAIEATDDRSGRLEIEVRTASGTPDEGDGDHPKVVEVSVSDNGQGLSAAEREKVFTPFYTTKARGSGLGLAIVERIVRNHGATIEVSSALGSGTRFCVRFPRSRERRESDPRPVPVESASHV